MNLKKFLPFENYVLTTSLSPDEVYKCLSDCLEPKQVRFIAFFKTYATKPYEGEISGNAFSINRIINYQNSFLPMINGYVSTFAGQTQIEITMKPATIVLVFVSFLLGISGLVSISMLLFALPQISQIMKTGFSPLFLIPFIMFIVVCFLTYIGFKPESKKSKEFLATLFNGQEKLIY